MTKKQTKNMRRQIVLIALSGVVLIFTTFSWFIGMASVDVSSFNIDIASAENLLLSLDGANWDTTVSINKENLADVSYPGHTNWWSGRGLIPVSTIGKIDTAISRLELFEKAAVTSLPGGFSLMASRVANDGPTEDHGYIAFDLFVRNFTGSSYSSEYDILSEEGIYLSTDSSVTVSLDGGVEETGLENSVRVAFAQIGRVIGTELDQGKITGITCNPDAQGLPSVVDGVTGICRTASIWEPNDKNHVDNAISWYNTHCLARKADGTNSWLSDSYDGSCNSIVNGNSYPTHVVSDEIASSDYVNIYDGATYNTYTGSSKLFTPTYFTDTDKLKTGVERPPLMYLAPNSITKIRVYIYLEGQDIDNYDYASIGRKLSVKFGFTKQRFVEGDFGYDGPDQAPARDTVKPIITRNGDPEVTIPVDSTYVDQGATANDNLDGDITPYIEVYNPVNTSVAGTYTVRYNVRDWAGNWATEVTRTVIVQ